MSEPLERVHQALAARRPVWFFLDYDGTLADFAPTPEVIQPDPALADLLRQLVRLPAVRLTVISGRRLSHVRQLVPVASIWLAGTYGLELVSPAGEEIDRLEYARVRPVLEHIKPRWQAILQRVPGTTLEDKGWTLAIHAKNAIEGQAREALAAARQVAMQHLPDTEFQMLGGHRFLEIGPSLADKGKTVAYLLQTDPWPGALLVYVGDDDKDAAAFPFIRQQDGVTVGVGPRRIAADAHLDAPRDVRRWLQGIL